MNDAAAHLEVTRATKSYGALVAVQDCSFSVGRNEIVSIVGPSGCGKTTLLWSMAGLHRLTAGEISLDGQAITKPKTEIGIVFQQANLLPWRNLASNIRFPFEVMGRAIEQDWIAHLIERVGLGGFEQAMPGALSGGMQQRAAIVRALSVRPSVLLMDEPFGALDAFTREEMNRLVEEIWLESKPTIVFITHSIEEAVFLSDRVIVLSARPGRVAADHRIDLPRPRTEEIMASRQVFDLMNAIKRGIAHPKAAPDAAAAATGRAAE